MSSPAASLQVPSWHPLRIAFMNWQCHVHQRAARDAQGRPDDAIMPALPLSGEIEPMGDIITVMNKARGYFLPSELRHMAAKTNGPAKVRDTVMCCFSTTYYRKYKELSAIRTATFPPGSESAAQIHATRRCMLQFEACAQRFDLTCKVWRLAAHSPLYQVTIAHNALFNPTLARGSEVLGFEPYWPASSAELRYGQVRA